MLGDAVGDVLGLLLGVLEEGVALGVAVGNAEGDAVGIRVGLLVGRALDGFEDGAAVCAVGALDGAPHTLSEIPTASTAFPTWTQSFAVIDCEETTDEPLKKSGSNSVAPIFNEHRDFTRFAKSFI